MQSWLRGEAVEDRKLLCGVVGKRHKPFYSKSTKNDILIFICHTRSGFPSQKKLEITVLKPLKCQHQHFHISVKCLHRQAITISMFNISMNIAKLHWEEGRRTVDLLPKNRHFSIYFTEMSSSKVAHIWAKTEGSSSFWSTELLWLAWSYMKGS